MEEMTKKEAIEKLTMETNHLIMITGEVLNEEDKAKRQELLADIIKTSEYIGKLKLALACFTAFDE